MNAVGTNRESSVPQTDTLLSQPPAVDPQASDLTTGGQHVEMDSESDDLSFMHALSHDGTGMKELQRTDPDIGRVLDWIERSESRPPQGQMIGSSRWLRKLWNDILVFLL